MHWILILNVCFAVLGTISAILAIFGETRRKDRAGIFKGLTTVGWGALVCTALTLGVVVLKEVLTQAESAQQKKENEQLRSDLKDTRAKLVTEQELFRTTSEAIQAYAYDRLSSSTYSYVSDIGIMIAHASDGWLPRSKEEFFSKKSVDLVCRWLNAEGSAQVLPTRPWYARFNDISKEYEDVLVNLLNAYASRLPPSLIESLSGVLRSRLISLPKTLIVIHRVGKEKGFKSPPMICIGHSDEHQMDKAFAQVFKLVNQIGQAEKKFNLQARMDDKLLLSSLRTGILGASRLSESEVKSYLESQKR